jgi:hypothetical protein
MRNRLTIEAILLVVAFLLGFIPQYAKTRHLTTELRTTQQERSGAELRDLAGLAYLEAAQKNYGLAADTSGRFFALVTEAVNQTTDANRKKALEDLAAAHDKVMAALAKADPGVVTDLADLFTRTRQATQAATSQ